MLGKTNITTLSEGAVVTEIEDYKWIQMQAGITGNFVKAVYENGCLAAITADGIIAYTTDGEVWNTSAPEYESCQLNDIYWDGNRFILTGSHSITITDSDMTLQMGLILTTVDFLSYEQIEVPGENSIGDGTSVWISEYLGVYMENRKYFMMAVKKTGSISTANHTITLKTIYLCRVIGDLVNKWETEISRYFDRLNPLFSIAKSINKFIVSYNGTYTNGSRTESVDAVSIFNNYEKKDIEVKSQSDNLRTPVFECRNELYYMRLYSSYNYEFGKVLENDEKIVLSQNINYGFVDGIYFNECQLFISSHAMLIVKKGESIADKTIDDLVEIAPELTMNCITKAFGQLYIFGNQGAVLKSSVETNNEEAITVQALSAKKALAEAKKYTDEQFVVLEARIAALEGTTETE